MRSDIDYSALQVTSSVNLNYVSRTQLKAYAQQIIAANGLKRYYINRKWRLPEIQSLSAQQKIVAYVLLELHLATVDKDYFNIVPEVAFFRRNDSVGNGWQKIALESACIGTFRTICPIDRSVVAHVCVEKCGDGGIYNLEMTSSINDHQMPEQYTTTVEAIGYAMKNLFSRLGDTPHG